MGFVDKEGFKRKLIDEKNFFPAMVARALDEMPDADVVEVKHGEWIKKQWSTECDFGDFNHHSITCSVCGCEIYNGEPTNYCPNCGAKMDGGKTE